MHLLLNISRSKSNQTMKFGQLIKYNKSSIFLQSYVENEEEISSKLLFFLFKKVLYETKASGLQLNFNNSPQLYIQQKKCIKF